MAQAVITKAVKQELIAEIAPLLRKQLTADVLKAAKLSPAAPKTRAKPTTTSRDIPSELLERMLRVEERIVRVEERTVRVEEELKHLRADTNQLRKDFMVQIDRMDKRFDKIDERFIHVDNTANKNLNSTRWFIGIVFVAISTLITVYQFLN